MIKFSVTKNGENLSKDLYTWDEHTRTFFTKENELVLDFSGIDNCTFNTGTDCIFKTSYNCTFKTGENCFVIRYDVKGVIEIPANKTIKLNGRGVAGYTIIEEKKETSCDGKIVEIDGKKYKLIEQ